MFMKKNKILFLLKSLLLTLCFFAAAGVLWAQPTAKEIETLLETRAVTYAQASRFVLEAADVKSTENPETAFTYAVEHGWLPKNVASGDEARLDIISLLLMRAFKTGGGIMYTLTGKPRFAYRELVYLNVIQGRYDPAMLVPGERLLFYVTRMLARQDHVNTHNGEQE